MTDRHSLAEQNSKYIITAGSKKTKTEVKVNSNETSNPMKHAISALEKQASITNNIHNSESQRGVRSSFRDFRESVIDYHHDHIKETITERNIRVRNRRGAFRWLPVFFANDLLHGSYWFLWGSILAMVIPIIPLVAIYEVLWENEEAFYPKKYTAVYSLLVVIGIFYSIGSYFFLRVFKEPPVPALLNFSTMIFSTDEIIGAWMFFLGTSPSIPIVALYVYEEPHSSTFIVALIVSVIATVSMGIFVYLVIPIPGHVHKTVPTHKLDFIKSCCPNSNCFNKHLENDWLIAAWLFLLFSAFSVIISIGKLSDSIHQSYERGVYDWSTGLVNCVMFTIGSAYFVAGSYPYETTLTEVNNNANVKKVELKNFEIASSI